MTLYEALNIVRGLTDEQATAVAQLLGGVSPPAAGAMGGGLDLLANLLRETDFSDSALRGRELAALLQRYVVATERTAAALEWLTTLAVGGDGLVRFDYGVTDGELDTAVDEFDQRPYCNTCGTLLDDVDECALCFATAVMGSR